MSSKQKLELTWIGKDVRPKLEPRILLEDPIKSYHAKQRVSDSDIFDNKLIFGDNLLALKALEAEFFGKINCIYIDPPYNTGSAFEHYDDALEHSTWLGLMRDRLEVLRRLLSPQGFICCHIDDSEGHYLKVLMDEVFGRSNYLVTMYVQVRYAEKTLKQDMAFHKQVEQVHVYRRGYGAMPIQKSKSLSLEKFCHYVTISGSGRKVNLGGKKVEIFSAGEWRVQKKEGSKTGLKEIWATGSILDGNSSGRFFRDYISGRVDEDGLGALYKVEGIGDDGLGYRYLTGPARAGATKGKYFQGIPLAKLEPDADEQTSPIENFYDLAANFGNCRHEGGVDFRSGKKPEALLEIVLQHFSAPGDIVLDSFAGSGSTGAVAHKMGRRWILVELGDHCHTHIVPRLKKVIDGEDTSGVTESAGWKGGGGFRYYSLAPSLLQQDRWGNWIINKEYNAEMLAAAICKLEGFTYAPNDVHYWQHGYSTEADFIYVTTQTLNADQLQALSDEVGESRSLLVCCAAYRGSVDRFANLTLKKIPKMVLSKCEWGHDDYSLNVENLPTQQKPKVELPSQGGLFGNGEEQA
jgi:adenine-specific DNA-methyltransferase